jgi:addiction module RelE/StbE family toxin
MTPIIWSQRSLADLEAIEAYIARDNPAAARRLVQKIVQRADRLHAFPLSGGIALEDDQQRYRQVLLGNYRVIYRYDNAANIVYVITVIHAARLLDVDDLAK